MIEALPGLWSAHATQRAREVGQPAGTLCAALSEPERRRYWCRVLWQTLRLQNEGRGGVQVFTSAASRRAADLEEGGAWRNPSAVLVARLRVA